MVNKNSIDQYELGFINALEKRAGFVGAVGNWFGSMWNKAVKTAPSLDKIKGNPGGYWQYNKTESLPEVSYPNRYRVGDDKFVDKQVPKVDKDLGCGPVSDLGHASKYTGKPFNDTVKPLNRPDNGVATGFTTPVNDQSSVMSKGENLPNNTQLGRRGVNNSMIDYSKTRYDLAPRRRSDSKWHGRDGYVY